MLLPALVVMCTGCAGSLLESKTPAPDVYRLSGTELPARGDTLPLALAVTRPRAALSLDTERIAVVQPDSRFDYFSGVRWSEPAPQMLQQQLVRALSSDGRFATVLAAPTRVPSDLMLDLELRRFEAIYPAAGAVPRVRVELQVTLVDARTAKRLSSFLVQAEATAVENRRAAVLEAFEAATGEALVTTVARIREVPPASTT